MVVFNEGKPAVYKQVQTLVEAATEDTFTLTLNKKQMLFLLQIQGQFPAHHPCNLLSYTDWCATKNTHFKDKFDPKLEYSSDSLRKVADIVSLSFL